MKGSVEQVADPFVISFFANKTTVSSIAEQIKLNMLKLGKITNFRRG